MIYRDQIDQIGNIVLTDRDPNAGHATLINSPDGRWLVVFDFRYNAGRIREMSSAAEEFFEAARFAAEQGLCRAFLENLFAVTELVAKGSLLLLPDRRLLDSKSHRFIARQLNAHGRLGHIDPAFVELHNKLSATRGDARYVEDTVTVGADEMTAMMATVQSMLEGLKKAVPERFALTRVDGAKRSTRPPM